MSLYRVDNAIYRGVMSLLLSKKVRDFGQNRRPLLETPWEEIEDHHIYPKRFLAPYGIKGNAVNNIANRSPITRATNQAIGNSAPHVYLTDTNIVGTEDIRGALEGHLINEEIVRKAFTEDVYSQFIRDRSKRIIAAIGAAVSAEPIIEQPA